MKSSAQEELGDIVAIKEFSVNKAFIYTRKNIKLDKSDDFAKEVSTIREPIFEDTIVFLRLLTEGDIDLYEYIHEDTRRYFYSPNDTIIKPLIYKKYQDEYGKVKENNTFRQQLLNALQCTGLDTEKFTVATYDRRSLTKVFVNYNKCATPIYQPSLSGRILSGHTNFEKGYFINNANEKVECLINNLDWRNNPDRFTYKLDKNAPKQIGDLTTIKEFNIKGGYSFERKRVKLDKSVEYSEGVSINRAPVFEERIVFLKVLIKGNASLYEYLNEDTEWFFFSKNDTIAKPLIYKKYLKPGRRVGENNTYQQQLLTELSCSEIRKDEFQLITYTQQDLIAVFTTYNQCIGTNFEIVLPKAQKEIFYLSLRPGIVYSTYDLSTTSNSLSADFGHKINFRIGAELEYTLPYNNGIWSLALEPTYQYFSSEVDMLYKNVYYPGKINYQAIEASLSVRRYFAMKEKSKLFLDVSFIYGKDFNSKVAFYTRELLLGYSMNWGAGVGFKYNDKYILELKYQASRDILDNYISWTSNYRTVNLIFGYSFFKKS